jgi:hypothetical protein
MAPDWSVTTPLIEPVVPSTGLTDWLDAVVELTNRQKTNSHRIEAVL